MPLNICSDFFVMGTNPFYPAKSTDEVEGETSFQGVRGEGEVENEAQHAQTQTLKLPSLTKSRTEAASNGLENDDLQVLLRVRCFDFPLQVHGLLPSEPMDKSREHSSAFPRISESGQTADDHDMLTEGEDNADSTVKDKKSFLPLSPATVLEGLKLKLRSKRGMKIQQKTQGKEEEEDNYSVQTDLNSREDVSVGSDLVYRKSGRSVYVTSAKSDKSHCTDQALPNRPARKSSMEGKGSRISHQDSRSSIFPPVQTLKQANRATLPLPKADKYDINPKNVVEVKVCSVFKGSVLKSMLIYSGYNDSWVPSRDGRLIKNAVFKAIMQQPGMFLRQPPPKEGMQKSLNQNNNLPTKLPPLPVETVSKEVTRGAKKLVVKLPPIY